MRELWRFASVALKHRIADFDQPAIKNNAALQLFLGQIRDNPNIEVFLAKEAALEKQAQGRSFLERLSIPASSFASQQLKAIRNAMQPVRP